MPLTQVDQGLLSSTAQYTGFKNRIINGAMVIDQRNAGASVTPIDTAYTLDRWSTSTSQASKFTIQQNAGSVTPPSGFNNYLGLTVGAAANVTVGTTDYFGISQSIEGFNFLDFGFGASGASTVTLSFWIRSSLTGTFGGVLRNSASNRAYPFTYVISASNTWEQKTVTIVGDTTGTWLKTNGIGATVFFSIGMGSTYTDVAGAWTSKASTTSANGSTNLVATNSATFYITGVQLEKGSTATSFDLRPYGTELALCQRYFSSSFVVGTAPSNAQNYITNGFGGGLATYSANVAWTETMKFPVSMRTTPTMTYYSVNLPASPTANQWVYYNLASWNSMTSTGPQDCNQDYFNLAVTGTWSANVNFLYAGAWAASAEL